MMNNIMPITLNNISHKAKINYDADIGMFRGEFIGLNGGADFYSDTVSGLESEGRQSLQTFLAVCQEKGIEPYQHYSGKFMTRTTSESHKLISERANAQGKSINQWINDLIQQDLSHA